MDPSDIPGADHGGRRCGHGPASQPLRRGASRVGRVTALALWGAFGLLLVGKTDQSWVAAQTVAPVRADEDLEETGQGYHDGFRAARAPGESGADVEAIRRNLSGTLAALEDIRARRRADTAPIGPVQAAASAGAGTKKAEDRDYAVIRADLISTVSALRALRNERSPEETAAPAGGPTEVPAGVAKMEDRPIGSLTTEIGFGGGALPTDFARQEFSRRAAVPLDGFAARGWPGLLYEWEAPGLCHGPLYFEEVNLERYGYAHRRTGIFQPVISGGRFVGTIAALPYMMTLRPPRECVYTLGHYRPGSRVPFQTRLMELDLKAAAAESAAITGLIFAIP